MFFSSVVLSQTRGISYQALIIDPITQELPGVNNSNAPLANKDICLKFSFIDELNTLEYEEIFSVRTDNYGMVNLIIGTEVRTGGYASSFEDIQWSLLPKNLKIDLSTDIGCTTFTEISNSPFTAVPFALFAVNTVDNPLILENQREIALLRALIRATQIGAGLDADGGYTPEATTFFINSVTSLKEADIVLDNQVKINENNINTNIGSITTNTSNIATNTININNNTTDIATNVSDIAVNTTNITTNINDIATNVADIVTNTTDIITNNINIGANTTNITNNTTDISTNLTDIATNVTNITNNTTDIATKVDITDIVDDLVTGGTTVPLSAEQGKVLKALVDSSVNIQVEDVLTSSSTINALSANQGRVLKAYVDATNSTNANLTGMVTSVGNATTVVTNANLTGDVTSVGNTTTIGNDKVVSVMIADTNVTNAKLDKTNIPLSGFAAATDAVALGANKLTGVADPTAAQDAATKAYVDAAIPVGGIIMWYGALIDIPSNWQLCDGSAIGSGPLFGVGNNTPDLTNRFIIGADSSLIPNTIGGSSNNGATIGSVQEGTNSFIQVVTNINVDNRPPYYALAYIIRIE